MNVARPQAVSSRAFRFVLLVGVMSFFADFVYEGSRSIIGPYLAFLCAGPLAIAGVLAVRHGGYRLAFAVLAAPAAIMLAILVVARLLYPRPEEMETNPPDVRTEGLPRLFWIYLGGSALVAMGFADFPLIAFHFHRAGTLS